jgi:hypothetical protein
MTSTIVRNLGVVKCSVAESDCAATTVITLADWYHSVSTQQKLPAYVIDDYSHTICAYSEYLGCRMRP